MDVLLYMNPSHRQRILQAVGERMNRAYARFRQAHPNFRYTIHSTADGWIDVGLWRCDVLPRSVLHSFMHQSTPPPHTHDSGKVSVVGHSLGSVILFDLLVRPQRISAVCVQASNPPSRPNTHHPLIPPKSKPQIHQAHQRGQRDDRVFSPLDATIRYPTLDFPIDLFMAMGSPVGLFLVVRETVRLRCGSSERKGTRLSHYWPSGLL